MWTLRLDQCGPYWLQRLFIYDMHPDYVYIIRAWVMFQLHTISEPHVSLLWVLTVYRFWYHGPCQLLVGLIFHEYVIHIGLWCVRCSIFSCLTILCISSVILLLVILYCLLELVAHFACVIPSRGKAKVDAGPSGVWDLLCIYDPDVHRFARNMYVIFVPLLGVSSSVIWLFYLCEWQVPSLLTLSPCIPKLGYLRVRSPQAKLLILRIIEYQVFALE